MPGSTRVTPDRCPARCRPCAPPTRTRVLPPLPSTPQPIHAYITLPVNPQGTGKLQAVHTANWNKNTLASWRHSIWVGVFDPWIVVFKGPRIWYKTIREIVTLERMHQVRLGSWHQCLAGLVVPVRWCEGAGVQHVLWAQPCGHCHLPGVRGGWAPAACLEARPTTWIHGDTAIITR